MEKKSSDLTHLGTILERRVIGGHQPVLNLLDLINKWPQIVGTLVAEKAFPVRVTRRTLMLRAESPMWAQELQLMAPKLLKEISEHCPQLKIERLRFVT